MKESIRKYIPRPIGNKVRMTSEWLREISYSCRKALVLYLYAHVPQVTNYIKPVKRLETYADPELHQTLLTPEQRAEQQREFTESQSE